MLTLSYFRHEAPNPLAEAGDFTGHEVVWHSGMTLSFPEPVLLVFGREVLHKEDRSVAAGVAKWQTRQTQNLFYASKWGFKSLHRHT